MTAISPVERISDTTTERLDREPSQHKDLSAVFRKQLSSLWETFQSEKAMEKMTQWTLRIAVGSLVAFVGLAVLTAISPATITVGLIMCTAVAVLLAV